MPFDLKSAKELGEKTTPFDPKSAKELSGEAGESSFQRHYAKLSGNSNSKRAVGVMQNVLKSDTARLLAGPGANLAGSLIENESMIPMVGQVAGGLRGGIPGAVAAGTLGEAGRRILSTAKGKEQLDTDPKSLSKTALGIAASEAVFRGGSKLLFGRAQKLNELKTGVGRELGIQQRKLAEMSDANPKFSVSKDEIIKFIDDKFDKIDVKSGAVATYIRQFKNAVKDKATITARSLIEFEKNLGDKLQFSKTASKTGTRPKNQAVEEAGRSIRDFTSKKVNALAKQAGFKNFSSRKVVGVTVSGLNEKVSRLLKQTSARPSVMERVSQSGVLGTVAGVATRNPMIGAGVTGASLILSNPAVRQAIYNATGKNGGPRVAAALVSDAIRRLDQE